MTVASDLRPPRARRKEARPQEIVAAALHLFAKRGYAATRLDDVATLAGVSKGTLYLYFANKEALFRAVVQEAVVPNIADAEQLVASFPGPTATMLQLLLERLLSVLDTEVAGVPKLIMAEAGNFPEIARFYGEAVVQRALSVLRNVLERGIARGEFRAVNLPATLPLIVAPFLTMALWERSLGPHVEIRFDKRAVLQQHIDFLLRALAPETRT